MVLRRSFNSVRSKSTLLYRPEEIRLDFWFYGQGGAENREVIGISCNDEVFTLR
jgi:hypothetical protein